MYDVCILSAKSSQPYNLRPRSHNFILSAKTPSPDNCNFVTRMYATLRCLATVSAHLTLKMFYSHFTRFFGTQKVCHSLLIINKTHIYKGLQVYHYHRPHDFITPKQLNMVNV